jgi:hypothetical protein
MLSRYQTSGEPWCVGWLQLKKNEENNCRLPGSLVRVSLDEVREVANRALHLGKVGKQQLDVVPIRAQADEPEVNSQRIGMLLSRVSPQPELSGPVQFLLWPFRTVDYLVIQQLRT